MACEYIRTEHGAFIVCGLPRTPKGPPCVGCGRPSMAQCDFPVHRTLACAGHAGEGTRTCDAPLCQRCRWPVPGKEDTDYCPEHRAQAMAWSKKS